MKLAAEKVAFRAANFMINLLGSTWRGGGTLGRVPAFSPVSFHVDPVLPADDAPAIDWLLFEQDQVLTRRQAVAEIGRGRLQNHLTSGRWQPAGRGVVIAHNGPVTRNQRLWVAVLAAGDGAVCAGVTAATLEGLRGYDRAEIHLLVPADRKLGRLRGVAVHRTTALPDAQVRIRALPPRTVVARSLVDAAAWARTDDDARAIVAAGFQQGRVTADEIGQVLAVLPRTRRRGLVRETVRYASGGAEALSEIHLAQLCRRFGLPAPDQQVQRKDRSGRQRYLDAYWHAYHLHVEVDGAWHLEVRSWWDDMRRQNDLWIRGDRVLRFPAWVLRSHPDSVAAQLRSALTAGGWRP